MLPKETDENEIKTSIPGDKFYPENLEKIIDLPPLLYYKGIIIKKENCLAIVGTRRASDYGKEIAYSLSYDLARAGLTIVSGLAKGIDAFAHKGALDAKGRTIAVLGTGLDEKSIYPRENLSLARRILKENGCLLSEYPVGTPGDRFRFPRRNRLIAGLSLGILIVEAKIKSGALITAAWAEKQGKKIFATPGNIHTPNTKGPHFLIKSGKAKLVETADDILKELNLPAEEIKTRPSTASFLSKEECLILKMLENGALSIDKIIEKTGFPSQKVSAHLSLLEIEGKIKNLGGNVYALLR